MALERALKRLSLEPSSICRQCRRTLSSTSRPRQQQGATAGLAKMMHQNRSQSATQNAASIPPRPTSLSPNENPNAPTNTNSPYDLMSSITNQIAARKKTSDDNLANLERNATRKDYEMQQHRRWRTGDVYAPHDLSGVEASKWRKLKQRGRPKWDVLDQLNLKPMDHYKNFSIMSEYVTDFGRIKHSRDTGLRPRNQRKMAKAVRRAIGLGLIPSVYKHPELLEEDVNRRMPRGRY